MAIYTYDTKNDFGFKHHLFTSLMLVLVAAFAIKMMFIPIAEHLFYPLYLKTLATDAGDIGAQAQEQTPIVSSIEEIEETDKFTLLVDAVDFKYADFYIGKKIYYLLELPSGEKVVARINRDAVQYVEEPQKLALLPIGSWKPLKLDRELASRSFELERATTTDHYVDMKGDFGSQKSSFDFAYDLGNLFYIFNLVLFTILIRYWGVRTGRYAPFMRSRRDPMLAQNDLELWAASTYAIWAQYFNEGWPVMGGTHRNRRACQAHERSLNAQWGIHNAQEGLQVVRQLVQAHRGVQEEDAAWDLCRAAQLVGTFYLLNWIDREEMDRQYLYVCSAIQRRYSSWEQLCEDYLEYYGRWVCRQDPNAGAKQLERRTMIYKMLKYRSHGPYSLPWNLNLMHAQNEREQVKQVYEHFGN